MTELVRRLVGILHCSRTGHNYHPLGDEVFECRRCGHVLDREA